MYNFPIFQINYNINEDYNIINPKIMIRCCKYFTTFTDKSTFLRHTKIS